MAVRRYECDQCISYLPSELSVSEKRLLAGRLLLQDEKRGHAVREYADGGYVGFINVNVYPPADADAALAEKSGRRVAE